MVTSFPARKTATRLQCSTALKSRKDNRRKNVYEGKASNGRGDEGNAKQRSHDRRREESSKSGEGSERYEEKQNVA